MASAVNPLEGIQQDKDGNYFDVVDLGDGSGPQIYKGKTVAELLGKYRNAQLNATKKIREQNRALKIQQTPDPATPANTYATHTPSVDELWQLSEDLKNPAKAAAAIRRAMVWELGADPAVIRESIQRQEAERRRQETFEAGREFMAAHPEFKPCTENEEAIFGYLDARGWAYTRKNMELAYEALKSGLVLIASPPAVNTQTQQPEAVIPQTVTRPRIATTGLSPRTSSAVPPRESTAKTGRLTEAEINAMDTREYARRLESDPLFAAEAERVLNDAAKARAR